MLGFEDDEVRACLAQKAAEFRAIAGEQSPCPRKVSDRGALPSLSPSLFLILRGRGEQEDREPHYEGRVAAMLISAHCEAAGSFHLSSVGELRQVCVYFVLVFSTV